MFLYFYVFQSVYILLKLSNIKIYRTIEHGGQLRNKVKRERVPANLNLYFHLLTAVTGPMNEPWSLF